MPLRALSAVAAAAVLLPLAPGRARAEEPLPTVAAPPPGTPPPDHPSPFTLGPRSSWYVLGGVTTGGTTVAHDRGGFVGGEASVVRLSPGERFVGLYGDGYYDVGGGRTYTTAGVEGGMKFLGVDGGAAARFGDERSEWGVTGRVFATVGVASVYGRYAYFLDAVRKDDEHVVQIGVLLKVPIASWGLE